jgi:hypothetical protein
MPVVRPTSRVPVQRYSLPVLPYLTVLSWGLGQRPFFLERLIFIVWLIFWNVREFSLSMMPSNISLKLIIVCNMIQTLYLLNTSVLFTNPRTWIYGFIITGWEHHRTKRAITRYQPKDAELWRSSTLNSKINCSLSPITSSHLLLNNSGIPQGKYMPPSSPSLTTQ